MLKKIINWCITWIKSKLKKQTKNNDTFDKDITVVSCKVRYIKTKEQTK